jgi:hypothetical protein
MEMNISQLIELTGLNDRTVRKRLKTLNPVREDGRAKFYDTKEALTLLYPTVAAELQRENLLFERAKRKKAEIEVAKLSGELIPIAVIAREVSKEYSIVRTQVRSLPTKLAKALAITTDPVEVQSRLTKAIDDVLTELSADAIYTSKKRDSETQDSVEDNQNVGIETNAETQSR